MNEERIRVSFVYHVAMVLERESQDRSMARAVALGRKDEGPGEDEEIFQRLTLAELSRRMVFKRKELMAYTHRILRVR